MNRRVLFPAIALALMGVAGALLLLPRSVPPRPPAAPLEAFPDALAGWLRASPDAPDVLEVDAGAPQRLSRVYERGTDRIWVAVDYYPSQGGSQREAARKLVFPGRGWTELVEQTLGIPLAPAGGSLPANVVHMRTPSREVVITYWHQVGLRAVASDHWHRALLLYNRVVHGRADGALIRIASIVPGGGDPAGAIAMQTDFIQAFYPALLRTLPE